MGLAAVPLNHFLTDLHQKDRTPLEALDRNISSLKWKAFGVSALEKICYVALIAIMATILAISYSAIVLTGTMPLVLAAMALAAPIIGVALPKLAMLSQKFSRRVEMESQVRLELKNIEQWKTDDVNGFLEEQGLNPERIPLDALRQLNPDEPLCALLPLIARFNYFQSRAHTLETAIEEAPGKLEEQFAEKEVELGKPIDRQIKQKIRFESRQAAFFKHEYDAMPSLLNAAVLLQIIQTPTTTDLDIDPQSLEIPGVATFAPKPSWSERAFGRTHQPHNDDYLVFHPDLDRDRISLAEIEEHVDNPHNLQLMLFPNAN